jgi:Ras-related protein Rab-6A
MFMRKKEKVVLLGDEGVGKTSLVSRYVLDEFDDRYIATIGSKISKKVLRINNNVQILQIWDVLGQRTYHRTHTSCFSGATGAILVMDMTRPVTLLNIFDYWLPKLQMSAGKVPLIILGNKADLEPAPGMNRQELQRISKDQRILLIPTSAKTGQNVERAFLNLGISMLLDFNGPESDRSLNLEAGRVQTAVGATDMIIEDFCGNFTDRNTAMAILTQQFTYAGVDIRNPQVDALHRVVNQLGELETDIIGVRKARVKRTLRRRVLSNIA